MKDDVISNTRTNRDKQRMKIMDNVVSNIQEQKKIRRKKPRTMQSSTPKTVKTNRK